MNAQEVTLSTQNYVALLEAAYEKLELAEDPKVYKLTRAVYLILIVGCFILARNLPAYRQLLGGVMLLVGVFLLTSSLRYNVKKREQKKAKQPFDQMLYQISEVASFIFLYGEAGLIISLEKKDGSKRELDFTTASLTAYQQLKGAFLISNQEGIDFIIAEGLFDASVHETFHQSVKSKFEN